MKDLLLLMSGMLLSSYHNTWSKKYFKPKKNRVKNTHMNYVKWSIIWRHV
uniref:Uncharacterized protein n=1 Tax=Physcomitrium patens TaxID=3218 RepID=A0A2K1JGM2_PHYPA|nr:hypothetical protein PHYPA_018106 [Physcomitrium patens]